MAKTFNDPLFASAWYLVNTGQRGGPSRLDINVLSAWDKYTGKGVVVSVNDDGMDLTHPALAANLLTNLAYDGARETVGQGFVGASGSHGTVVGSIVGMAGNDGIGGVGVAYEAKIVPATAIGPAAGTTAKLFLANLAAGAAVSVNSWGQDPAFAENFGASGSQADRDWGAALARAATEARNGLGMVIEVSGGNERGNNADTAMSNFTGNKFTIAVGALTETGAPTDYSTRGASLLLTAPGGVAGPANTDTGFGIVSADVQGEGGYNKAAGTEGDYTYQNQGTSYSGPMVGGAAALMLQANPKLGFRDVSTILALTARQVDPGNSSWVKTAATDWNLGGMHFSRDFGYGLLDVSAAVRLAESWPLAAGTVANWQSAEGISSTASGSIPQDNPTGFTATANVPNNVRIERMEFDLNLTSASPSQLGATITSPSGTTITLFDQPLTRNLVNGAPDMSSPEPSWPSTFTVGSTAFLGENSAGTWTLKLTDKFSGATTSSFNTLAVRAWGSAVSDNSQYILTNEFAAANPTLADASGVDVLNAAAAANAVRLDLTPGNKSSVGSGEFTIAASTTIENAIGGLGDDTLIGNDGDNNLIGASGNDTLTAGAGNDAINGGDGSDTAILAAPLASYAFNYNALSRLFTISGTPTGTDTFSNVEFFQFSDVLRTASELEALSGTSPALSISPANTTITEGDTGSQSLNFTVTLSAVATSTVTVNYATANGTATAGSDYTATSGTLSFAAGETSKTIAVSVLGDKIAESSETFSLALSSPGGATLGSAASATATILDNDSATTLPSYTVPGTLGNDFFLPSGGNNYLGGGGSDTYIISPHTLSGAVTAKITDTEGANAIQLVDGLTVASSSFFGNAVQLTLSNGASVQILGAASFTYLVGANAPAGDTASGQTYAQFAAALGASIPTGSTPISGGANFVVPSGITPASAPTPATAGTAATVPGTLGNDFFLPSGGNNHLGGGGSDTYIISPYTLSGAITAKITDTEGVNVIQLVDGLTIASSSFFGNAVQLTLSNGANVQILGASGFSYQVGANAPAGDTASSQTYAQFAATLGASVPTGSTPVSGTANFVVPTSASPAALMADAGDTGAGVALVGINVSDAALAYGMPTI